MHVCISGITLIPWNSKIDICRITTRDNMSLFQQPIAPTAHCSDSSLFRHTIVSTTRYADSPLFRRLIYLKPIITTTQYSDNPLFQKPIVPILLYSDSPSVRQSIASTAHIPRPNVPPAYMKKKEKYKW